MKFQGFILLGRFFLLALFMLNQGCEFLQMETKIRGVADKIERLQSIEGLFESEDCMVQSASLKDYSRASVAETAYNSSSTIQSFKLAIYISQDMEVYAGRFFYSDSGCKNFIAYDPNSNLRGSALRHSGSLKDLGISSPEGFQSKILTNPLGSTSLVQLYLVENGYYFASTEYTEKLPVKAFSDLSLNYPILGPFIQNPTFDCRYENGIDLVKNEEFCNGNPNYMIPSGISSLDLQSMVKLADAEYQKSLEANAAAANYDSITQEQLQAKQKAYRDPALYR